MRQDYDRLKYVSGKLREIYPQIQDIYFSENEDFGIDLSISATTHTGCTEVKSLSHKFGAITGDYFTYSATTDPTKWRWCKTGRTQEDIEEDETPYPIELKDKRVVILNATDKWGNTNNGKLGKLLRTNAGLIYLAQDGILSFSPRQLKDAIITYGYLKCRHTKEIPNSRECHWELKVLLDIDRGKYIPLDDVPQDLLN